MNYIQIENNAPNEQIVIEMILTNLKNIFDKALPNWSVHPRGILSKYWKCDNRDAFNFLVYLSMVLGQLQSKLTNKSNTRLLEKLKILLTTNSEAHFEEIFFELEVGFNFAQVEEVEAIAMEPLTLMENFDAANRPHSPDYAIRLADGDFFVEATVSYNNVLKEWDNSMSAISKLFEKPLQASSTKKTVIMQFPLVPELKSFSQNKENFQSILEDLVVSNIGQHSLSVANKEAVIKWELAQPIETVIASNEEGSFSRVDGPVSTIRMSIKDLDQSYSERMVFKSLDSSLRNKKAQLKALSEQAPLIIAMRANHYRLNSNSVLGLIHHRLWPKPSELGYSIFSGIAMVTPMILPGIRTSAAAIVPRMTISLNPKAIYPVSASFLQAFNIEETEQCSSGSVTRLSCFD